MQALADTYSDPEPPPRVWRVHEGQGKILTSTSRFKVVPAGRRWGKSEVAVMWICRLAQQAHLEGKHGVIWIVYPTYGVGSTAWRKFRRIAPHGWVTHQLGTDQRPGALRFGNVVVEFHSAQNPETLVGEGLLGVWVDECGTVRERVWSESLRPTLIDYAAPALFTGTPKGRNWFWRLFSRGQDPAYPEYESFGAGPAQGMPTHSNPFLPKPEIAELARDMSQRVYEQEILAHFLSDEGAVFRKVREAVDSMGGLYCTEHPTVAIGVDLARRVDFTVLTGMCREGDVTFFDRFNAIDWSIQKARIQGTWEKLGRPAIVADATGVGDPIVEDLRRDIGSRVEGFVFTGQSKTPLIESLIIAFDEGSIGLPDEPVLVNELESFDMTRTPSGGMRYEAPEGQHDDCVMSLALAFRGACRFGDHGLTF